MRMRFLHRLAKVEADMRSVGCFDEFLRAPGDRPHRTWTWFYSGRILPSQPHRHAGITVHEAFITTRCPPRIALASLCRECGMICSSSAPFCVASVIIPAHTPCADARARA